MKLAIFLPNWVGDVVMATPALRAVRDQFPAAQIVGIMRPHLADVLAGSGLIDELLFYNPRGSVVAHRGWPFIRSLRSYRFDTALLLTNSLRTAWLAWLSGARKRIGFARDLRGWLLTDRVAPMARSIPHPALDDYRILVERMGCAQPSRHIELAITDRDRSDLTEFWEEATGAQPDLSVLLNRIPSYVCFNTGGAFGKAKNWPLESFVELALRVVHELDRNVLVVCGPSERNDARWIAEQANNPRVFSLADAQLSIGLTKAAVRDADLLVTTDSGPRHFAAAFQVPVITLFGPTHIAWSETYYDKAEHLQLKLDCGPCQQRECPLQHHRCMKELAVDTVFSAVRRQLEKRSLSRRVA